MILYTNKDIHLSSVLHRINFVLSIKEKTMEKRPWPIILLALFHFLEPQVKLFFYSWFWDVPVWRFISFMLSGKNPWGTFVFLFSFPLAGIAILAVKRWSLPVFITIQLLTLAQHIHDSRVAPSQFPPWLVALFVLGNLLVTTYFLLPAVRLAYTDPRVRWWEAKPRFQVRWPVRLSQQDQRWDAVIGNVAEGGFFCEFHGRVLLDTTQELAAVFSYQQFHFQLQGTIRHSRFDGAKSYYGVKFANPSAAMAKSLKRCMRLLDKQGFDRKPARENPVWAFFKSIKEAATTGKGFVPEVHSKAPAEVEPNKKKVA
jgi:hypothetical protein